MGLFYSSPSKPNFSRIGRGAPLPMRPPKKTGNTTLTWFLKLLNRISALPPNLALGMKTHTKFPCTKLLIGLPNWPRIQFI